MKTSLIVAVANNGVIGIEDRLPWRLSADLKRFKRLTMGHHLILGRKTFDSIGRPLPGRRMLVMSRREPPLPEGVARASSLEAALEVARKAGDTEAFVGGGAEIYRLALPRADRLYLTRVDAAPEGDVRFPPVDWRRWRRRYHERHPADGAESPPFTFEIWDRSQTG